MCGAVETCFLMHSCLVPVSQVHEIACDFISGSVVGTGAVG